MIDLLNRRTSRNSISGCWNYLSTNAEGYGQIGIEGKYYRVHRLSASIFLGFDLNSNLCVCHKCDNPQCWNPEHLFVGERIDNNRDRTIKGKSKNQYSDATHCVNGHEFTEENITWRRVNGRQSRRCNECQRISNEKARIKKEQRMGLCL
jgi:hypothetical protein